MLSHENRKVMTNQRSAITKMPSFIITMPSFKIIKRTVRTLPRLGVFWQAIDVLSLNVNGFLFFKIGTVVVVNWKN